MKHPQPLRDLVLVKVQPREKETAAGIIIPQTTAKEQKSSGDVIEVGQAVEGITVGDRVMFSRFAGTEVQQDDNEFVIVPEGDVLAKLDKDSSGDDPKISG